MEDGGWTRLWGIDWATIFQSIDIVMAVRCGHRHHKATDGRIMLVVFTDYGPRGGL